MKIISTIVLWSGMNRFQQNKGEDIIQRPVFETHEIHQHKTEYTSSKKKIQIYLANISASALLNEYIIVECAD